MLAVILEFDVIEGKEEEFIVSWTECTQVIYEHFGSLGSRLHKSDTNLYIAYAQWPDQKLMKNLETGRNIWFPLETRCEQHLKKESQISFINYKPKWIY